MTEQERIARARAIDALYRELLGRPIDPNGVSYACSDLTLEAIREILRWGELPPQLFIADGWDDGRWPMLFPGMTSEQQEAVLNRADANHQNSFVLLSTNPDASNLPNFLRDRPLVRVPIHMGPQPLSLVAAVEKVQARGKRPFVFLWSYEAEQAFGNGKQHVKILSEALPPGLDVAVIELDEYWSDVEWNTVSAELAQRHRVWNHFTSGRVLYRWSWIHGLAYQADETEVDTAVVALSNAAQAWRGKPVLFAEAQNLSAAQRWEVAQWGFRRGIGSLHCGRPTL